MYLAKIVEYKRKEVETLKPMNKVRDRGFHDPVASLRERPFIAEIKKKSPSLGEINSSVNIAGQAVKYARGGAGAISVLTDSNFFNGSFDFLYEAGKNIGIPLLCKDFIISPVQIENAHGAGADFILLIAAILDEEELKRLSDRASALNMKVLYEIHDKEEFDKIKNLSPEMVGVNSRNLKTFEIDLPSASDTIRSLAGKGSFMIIAESGISSADDVRYLKNSGAQAFLIGTSLMKSPDPEKKLRELYSGLK